MDSLERSGNQEERSSAAARASLAFDVRSAGVPPMRRIYVDLFRKRLRAAGGIRWVARCATRYALTHLSLLARRPLCGPLLGTLVATYRCNLRCVMCDMAEKGMQLQRRRKEELSTEGMQRLIDEFAALGTLGIGITGGEPLLRHDIFELLAHVRRRGMISHLNTNGLLLNERTAEEVVRAGVESINISLDGATRGTHDAIRGVPGAFAGAVEAIRTMHCSRRRLGSPLRLKAVAVLSERNASEAADLIRFAVRLGADCVEFIPEQPLRGGRAVMDCAQQPISSEVRAAVKAVRDIKASGGPVENSDRMLRLLLPALSGAPSPLTCSSGLHSLAADCYGNLYPCLPWLNWQEPAARWGDVSLKDFRCGTLSSPMRSTVRCCRACYLNCQAELNLLFDLRRVPRG